MVVHHSMVVVRIIVEVLLWVVDGIVGGCVGLVVVVVGPIGTTRCGTDSRNQLLGCPWGGELSTRPMAGVIVRTPPKKQLSQEHH